MCIRDRDVPFETFLAKLPECRRQCGDRAVLRAFHVYADNDRVAKQVAALHDGDFDTFLSLVNESGCSSWEYLQNVIPAGYKEHQEVGVTIAAAKHLPVSYTHLDVYKRQALDRARCPPAEKPQTAILSGRMCHSPAFCRSRASASFSCRRGR